MPSNFEPDLRKDSTVVSLQDFLNNWAHYLLIYVDLCRIGIKHFIKGERLRAWLFPSVLHPHLDFSLFWMGLYNAHRTSFLLSVATRPLG